MLRWRLLLGTAMIAALVGLCWLDLCAERVKWEWLSLSGAGDLRGIGLIPLAVMAAVLATWEFLDLAASAGLHPARWTVYCGNVLLVTLGGCGLWFGKIAADEYDRVAPIWHSSAFGVAVLLLFLGAMYRYRKPGGNLADLAAGMFAIVYVGLMLSFAVRLRMQWGVGALASWVIVVKMGDTGAYTVGRLIGRRKMAPLISPGKTIEGAVGALAFSCLGAWLAFKYLIPLTAGKSDLQVPTSLWTQIPPSWSVWWAWIGYGLMVGVAGMLGDLAESLLKRDVGRKDSSLWLPGFGGVLDILDSLLLSAPVAWVCWAFHLVGNAW